MSDRFAPRRPTSLAARLVSPFATSFAATVTAIMFSFLLPSSFFPWATASAQDYVFLNDGSRVLGDVIAWGDELVMVTRSGELKRFPAADVKRTKRKPLAPAVAERLGEDTVDVKHLYVVGTWALGNKRYAKDGQRILKRILGLDPKNVLAREALGHVLYEGEWYEKPQQPYKQMREKMKADGYRWYQRAWVKKETLPQVKQSPELWMKYHGLMWRLVDEVRTERGDRQWNGEWYVEAAAAHVTTLEEIQSTVGEAVHVVDAGACRVYAAMSLGKVEKYAIRQDKARRWFVKAFDVQKREPKLVTDPRLVDYVFSTKDVFNKAIDSGYIQKQLRSRPQGLQMTAGGAKFAKENGSFCTTPFYGTNLKAELANWRLVSAAGLRLMDLYWKGDHGPDWLNVATAHHAEIAVLKEVRVNWVHPGSYGIEHQSDAKKGRNMRQLKEALRKAYSSEPIPSLRTIMMKDMNELNQRLDLVGTVYLQYLLEQHREALINFVNEPFGTRLVDRFQKHFKMTYEAMHQQFLKWLG